MSPFAESIRSILPELLLMAAACLQFLVGPFLITEGKASTGRLCRMWSVYSLAALLAAFASGMRIRLRNHRQSP